MNFFLDHNMPRGLANALAAVSAPTKEHEFLHHRDHWKKEDPGDDVWIPEVAKWPGSWRLVSGDRRILTTPQNKQALQDSRLIAFFMTKNFPRRDKWVQASLFFGVFPAIAKAAQKASVGALFYVTENGKVEPIEGA